MSASATVSQPATTRPPRAATLAPEAAATSAAALCGLLCLRNATVTPFSPCPDVPWPPRPGHLVSTRRKPDPATRPSAGETRSFPALRPRADAPDPSPWDIV